MLFPLLRRQWLCGFLLLFVALVVSLRPLHAAPSLPSSFAWQSETQGAFVSSMARNPRTGEVWFGVEDQGVYRYDPRAKPEDKYESGRWSNFRTGEGLGDNNAYALAIDPRGRVWAGSRTHGVAVWNGQGWRSYDVLSGPLGERVFCLAVSPLDGDVWIGTNRGLTRYSQKSDTWRNWTRIEGLPSDQIQTLAFAPDGTLFVGTQCDGLAIGKAGDDYKAWREVQGPERMPQTARGDGLPSNLLNAVLVGHDGTVYVGTDGGLARSRDNGATWQFLRGRDYADKIKGQYLRPNAPDIQEVRDADMDDGARKNLLLEDYVTSLAEDEEGRIWVGHPTQGIEARTPGAEEFAAGGVIESLGEWRRLLWQHRHVVAVNPLEQEEKTDFVMGILSIPGQGPLVSAYGAGAVQLHGVFFSVAMGGVTPPANTPPAPEQAKGTQHGDVAPFPAFPSPAAPPSVEELHALTAQLEALQSPIAPLQSAPTVSAPTVSAPTVSAPTVSAPTVSAPTVSAPTVSAPVKKASLKPTAVGAAVGVVASASAEATSPSQVGAAYVGDDWVTGGDWMGRYGTRYAFLSAMAAPLDHRVANDLSYKVEGRLGPHPYQDGKSYDEQSLRHWCHAERWDDVRVVYDPLIGYRREADVDDNGETYPIFYEGPDIWMGVRVPAGVHRVALYFFNKDGHEFNNRVRDYTIEVKRGRDDLLDSEAEPTLARARVRDFWGGVYKVFTLHGGDKGMDYFFWLRKSGTFNVVMQAVLLDKLSGPPTAFESSRDVYLGETRYEAPTPDQQSVAEALALGILQGKNADRLNAALDVWKQLDAVQSQSAGRVAPGASEMWQGPGRVLAYRAAFASLSSSKMASTKGEALLRSWRWTLPLWPQQDRQEFDAAMKKGWDSFLSLNPYWAQDTH